MATKYESPEIQALGQQWAKRKQEGASQAELDAIHAAAENLRKNQGYQSTNGWGNDFVSTSTGKKYTPSYKEEELITVETNKGKPLTYDTAEAWKEKYIEQQLALLQQNYDSDLANLLKAYEQNQTLGQNELSRVTADYNKNILNLYDDVYSQRKMAMQNAGRNGSTSTAQTLAASNASLYQAADKVAELTADRDVLKESIQRELNNLSADYNIDKATLEKNFNSAKLNAMSTGELQYLDAVLNIDKYNADLWNSLSESQTNREWQSAEADKDRLWQSAEAEKDRDFKIMLEQMFGGSGGSGNGGSNDNSSGLNANNYSIILMKRLVGYLMKIGTI